MFIVRGTIAPHGANYNLVGQYTYLSYAQGWYVWDGLRKVAHFETWTEALEAAGGANGPLFRMPSPETVEVIESDPPATLRPYWNRP